MKADHFKCISTPCSIGRTINGINPVDVDEFNRQSLLELQNVRDRAARDVTKAHKFAKGICLGC